ncbi:hypothetical protein NPIL_188721 [Nephila pilipes]|uniref:Uncharacterized protein n=1 Tax=Nephila pilipes TaxID=299642 RepID=A0A8X6PT87_NEPPI|nr:hypothetical protein NPIL_188721 [Nephila pilipes]
MVARRMTSTSLSLAAADGLWASAVFFHQSPSIQSSTLPEDRTTSTLSDDLKNNKTSYVDQKEEKQNNDLGKQIEEFFKSYKDLDIVNSAKSDSLELNRAKTSLENKSPNTILPEQEKTKVDSEKGPGNENHVFDFKSPEMYSKIKDSNKINDAKVNQSDLKLKASKFSSDVSKHAMKENIDKNDADDLHSLDLLIAQLTNDESSNEARNSVTEFDIKRDENLSAEQFAPDIQNILLGVNESSPGNVLTEQFSEDIIPFDSAAYDNLSELWNATPENDLSNDHTTESSAFSDFVLKTNHYSGLDVAEQKAVVGQEAEMNERNLKDLSICENSNCSNLFSNVPGNDAIIKNKGSRITAGNFSENDENNRPERSGEINAFEYLENIQFNLKEVYHIIITDKNVRAALLNSLILYIPVLICDVLLWMVIMKLVRHIRRQIVRRHAISSERLDEHQIQLSALKSSKPKFFVKSSRIGNDSDEDYCDSSTEFLQVDRQIKEWYPPG